MGFRLDHRSWVRWGRWLGRLAGPAGLCLALALGGCEVPSPQKPANVVAPGLWLTFAGGGAHTLGIKSSGGASGTLWSWGDNTYGQLGDGTTTSSNLPIQIGAFDDWVYVAAGLHHSIGLRNTSDRVTLWAWGDNTYGQLGRGSTATPVLVPTQEVTLATTWTGVPGFPGQISAGCNHTVAVQSDGSLMTWGANDFGQLGNSSSGTPQATPTRVDTTNFYFQVAAGCAHTLGVRITGGLYAWGDNSQGQLGNGSFTAASTPTAVTTLTANVIGVAAGENFSLAIRQNPPPAINELWAWGYNFYGQLGDGTSTSRNAPVQVVGSSNWLRVSAGQNHSQAVRGDFTAWIWGRNHVAQLGDGTTTDRHQPGQVLADASKVLQMAAGSNHSLGGTGVLSVFDWGLNDKGQLGDGTVISRSTPTALK